MPPLLRITLRLVTLALCALLAPVSLALAASGVQATVTAGAFPAIVVLTFGLCRGRGRGRGRGLSLLTLLRTLNAAFLYSAYNVTLVENKVSNKEKLFHNFLLGLLAWLTALPLLVTWSQSPVSRDGLPSFPRRNLTCVTAAAILVQVLVGLAVSLSLLTSVCTPTIHFDWLLLPADCSFVYRTEGQAWEFTAALLCLAYTAILALVSLAHLVTWPPGALCRKLLRLGDELRQVEAFFRGQWGLLRKVCLTLTFLVPLVIFYTSGPLCLIRVRISTPSEDLPRLNDPRDSLPYCQHNFTSLEVQHSVAVTWGDLQNITGVQGDGSWQGGGSWEPSHCRPWQRVAIIVPYRARERQLVQLLATLHPFLQRQLASYRVFVVEQSGEGEFNRGKVRDAGFLEAERRGHFHCYVFHDVDMLPERQDNLYLCGGQPRHLCPALDEMRYRLYFSNLLGGVVAMTGGQFRQANGYPTLYWGWGGEDDDLSARIHHLGMMITQPPGSVGRCKMLRHIKENQSSFASALFKTWKSRWEEDGISNPEMVRYSLVSETEHLLYTHLVVDIGQAPHSMDKWLKRPEVTSLWIQEFYHC